LAVVFAVVEGIIARDNICPPNLDVFKPCECFWDPFEAPYRTMKCNGSQPLDLKAIFQKLSHELKPDQNDYLEFLLFETEVNELPANVFGNITFKKFDFRRNSKLDKIHKLAFNGLQKSLYKVSFNR